MVELEENQLGSVPEKSLAIGGADFSRADVFAVSLWIRNSGEFPFAAVSIFVDENDQIVSSEIPLSARPLLSLVQRRNVFFLPDVPEGVDASLDAFPRSAMAFGFVGRRSRDDRRRGVFHHRRVEEVSRSKRLAVSRVGADGGKWTAVDDGFDLHDEGAECINVKRIQDALGRDVAFKHAHDAFPNASSMGGTRRDECPSKSFPLESSVRRRVPLSELLLEDPVGGDEVGSIVGNKGLDAWTTGHETGDGVDERVGVELEHDLGVDASRL